MAKLKCNNCGKEINVKFIEASRVNGLAGFYFGKFKVIPTWPFQTNVVSVCPACNQKSKLVVVATKRAKIFTTIILVAVLAFVFIKFLLQIKY